MSTSYQHILIAVDFSEQTEQICNKASAMAQPNQTRLSICHIVENFPLTDFTYEPMISVDADMRNTLISGAEKQLARLAEPFSIAGSQQFVECGHPGTDIVRIADEHAVDLIVVGSHGRHGIRLILGSTANAVLHHAHCDVLAVRLKD